MHPLIGPISYARKAICDCAKIRRSTGSGSRSSSTLMRQSTSSPSSLPSTSTFRFQSTSTSPAATSRRATRASSRPPWTDPADRSLRLPKQPDVDSPITNRILSRAGQPYGRADVRAAKQTYPAFAQQSGRGGSGYDDMMAKAARPPPPAKPMSLEKLNQDYEQNSNKGFTEYLRPCTTTSSRSLSVYMMDDFSKQYKRLMSGVIAVNNVRQELRLQERYEKPKYKRQRLQSARHRRRFAREVGRRVAVVMRAKSQGM
ncbi:MAG: hypothetical protein CYPHOPRED_004162 [Cyphobasidiales sp. Tagirdzhanova-0007]|nr:MAG: hypothetical protein CYPHOPRED_004162 [Cyphobasidiales sp. Tagirdzhanova-0007]